jgi:hypothetical protein
MGDIGALALGAALGVIAVIVRQEVVLLIMGGIFVLETASVILQVASFKLRGKRIFRMAPIHHHFELKGWAEPKVIVRFWIITVVLVLVGSVDAEAAMTQATRTSHRSNPAPARWCSGSAAPGSRQPAICTARASGFASPTRARSRRARRRCASSCRRPNCGPARSPRACSKACRTS